MKLIILQERGATGDGGRVVNHDNGIQLTLLWDRRLPPQSRMSAEKGGLMTLTNVKFILRESPSESGACTCSFSPTRMQPGSPAIRFPRRLMEHSCRQPLIKRARCPDARRTAHIKDDTSPTCSCR